jgi:hypothetical protein
VLESCRPKIQKPKNPKTQKPKNFAPRCENIIKMKKATFWVLVFAKTQKGSFIKSTKTQKPHTYIDVKK